MKNVNRPTGVDNLIAINMKTLVNERFLPEGALETRRTRLRAKKSNRAMILFGFLLYLHALARTSRSSRDGDFGICYLWVWDCARLWLNRTSRPVGSCVVESNSAGESDQHSR